MNFSDCTGNSTTAYGLQLQPRTPSSFSVAVLTITVFSIFLLPYYYIRSIGGYKIFTTQWPSQEYLCHIPSYTMISMEGRPMATPTKMKERPMAATTKMGLNSQARGRAFHPSTRIVALHYPTYCEYYRTKHDEIKISVP